MPKKRYEKLQSQTRKLASKFIAEEVRTKKYHRKQAIAIGISRAKTKTKHHSLSPLIQKLSKKYRISWIRFHEPKLKFPK